MALADAFAFDIGHTSLLLIDLSLVPCPVIVTSHPAQYMVNFPMLSTTNIFYATSLSQFLIIYIFLTKKLNFHCIFTTEAAHLERFALSTIWIAANTFHSQVILIDLHFLHLC